MAVGLNNGALTLSTALTVPNGGTGVSAAYSFSAYKSSSTSNVTGDGTQYTVIFDTQIEDTGNWYNNSTGVATAPVSGVYTFSYAIDFTGITVSHTSVQTRLVTTSNSYYGVIMSPYSITLAGGSIIYTASVTIRLSASNTISVNVLASGGSKVIGIYGDGLSAHTTFFTGCLVSL